MIVAFTGKARHGKDTAANILVEEFGFEKVGFADKLKAMALAINPLIIIPNSQVHYVASDDDKVSVARLSQIIDWCGWEEAKDRYPEVRRFLQALGTEGGRETLGDTVWIDAWQASLPTERVKIQDFAGTFNSVRTTFANVATPDCRFPNEAQRVWDLGGVVVEVVRTGYVDRVAGTKHKSEAGGIDVDYRIEASSVDSLVNQVRQLISHGVSAR